MSAPKRYYMGLMSGTSVDGIDCAIVNLDKQIPEIIAAHCYPLPESIRREILTLCKAQQLSFSELGRLDVAIARAFADAAAETLKSSGLTAESIVGIGSHGQTVFHEPNGDVPFSIQLGDPNTLAEITGITTVADFRQRDIAAGGQGAPIAPLLHRHSFAAAASNRLIVNIGGIANITLLPVRGPALAFDTGPGNVLMDYWIAKQKDARFDREGAWANSGVVNAELLARLRSETYFARPAPKSTGRELFNGAWLQAHLDAIAVSIDANDVQATLLELTARTITDAINAALKSGEIYVCGGGAHNTVLIERIAALAPSFKVATTMELGLDPDWVEAAAFAWMAQQTLAGKPVDTGPFTGAKHPIVLGGIYQSPQRC